MFEKNLERANTFFQSIKYSQVKNILFGHGTFITFDLVNNFRLGSIWIYLGAWRIEENSFNVLDSESFEKEFDQKKLSQLLEGNRIQSIRLKKNSIVLEFDKGILIKVFKDVEFDYSEDDDLIIFSIVGDKTFGVSANFEITEDHHQDDKYQP